MATYGTASHRAMANRSINAENDFVATLARAGSITTEEAEKVFAFYRKIKVINSDAYVGGRITVKHGAFLDADTIRRAAAEA